ncbi:MAG: hypothetical protein MJE66_15220 [Proteobacteria bacterium]|nr:hypothetical protein [Pseudomonadota bacterium]
MKSLIRRTRPLPAGFLEWQVRLRAHTMEHDRGRPHVGVAPILGVRNSAVRTGHSSHSIICGLLPRESQLAECTKEFRTLYETSQDQGARVLYDRGIAYLRDYYQSSDSFEPDSLTTLLHRDLPVVDALRSDPACSLLFYVFDLEDRSEIGRLRCTELHGEAEVLTGGPVYDNVWWHNTLFHGPADEHVVLHFRHRESYDTGFGRLEALAP